MKIPNYMLLKNSPSLSLARIVSEDSQHGDLILSTDDKSSKDS